MNNELHIKRQLTKFGIYGLLKNLRFFDPILLLYIYKADISITLIGVLFMIREIIVYLFEIPSGIIADRLGKKTELVLCFIFYILSFIFFYIGGEYYIFVIAFMLFGLGEAFRTGTHKAMIVDFMEYHDIKEDKSKIYGKTRSMSMIGSSISSVGYIVIILLVKDLSVLFLIAIVPYIIDLLLILSYPSYLNKRISTTFTFKDLYNDSIGLIVMMFKEHKLRHTLSDSALFNAVFKSIKDYLQYILQALFLGVIIFGNLSEEKNIEIVLGIAYAVIFLISSFASKNSYKLKGSDYNKSLPIAWLFLTIISILMIVLSFNIYLVILLFVITYIIQNIRKPIMVEKIGDCSSSDQRASILSVESQLTSIFIIVLAPVLGFLFDQYGFEYPFIIIGLISVTMYFATKK